ncbi:hypothetical protein [Novosphingobium sp. BL-52-GroH]|uniref:hypothetical protein n=1 Tax=Novosphingobium sp. BL-52-GroH TaxID=3349877 RepID=UPI00384D79B9
MSSDRRPAKVRVVSSGPVPSTPARRRTDEPREQMPAASAAAAHKREGGSLLWVAGALALFLVGCAIGGALFVLAGFTEAGSL